jgi:hypothetical protein
LYGRLQSSACPLQVDGAGASGLPPVPSEFAEQALDIAAIAASVTVKPRKLVGPRVRMNSISTKPRGGRKPQERRYWIASFPFTSGS